MRNAIILLFTICLFFSSCGKKDRDTYSISYIPINNDLLSHFSFKVGSYWIFKDSLSGRIDSFYVYDNRTTTTVSNAARTDYNSIQIAETNINNMAPLDSAQWIYNLWGNSWDIIYRFSNKEVVYPKFAVYPFIVGPLINSDSNKIESTGLTLTLNATIYTNNCLIYQSLTHGYPNIYSERDWFYANDSVGIAKMHLMHLDNGTEYLWELQRSHVVK